MLKEVAETAILLYLLYCIGIALGSLHFKESVTIFTMDLTTPTPDF